jgi:hypothetical protein
MLRAFLAALFLGSLAALPASAQETALPTPDPAIAGNGPDGQVSGKLLETPDPSSDEAFQARALPWQTLWGVVGLRGIFDGPKIGPDGGEYHPNFSLDLDINGWLWRSQGLYLFADARFWGEKSEDGVTNSRDGFLGTSKREFDLSGGVAWNYAGPWEARGYGYSYNNLNRGYSQVLPSGFNDGSAFENRYYLSPEYAKLGQTGFDVTRATFLSVGYYPSKNMVGNDGQAFKPGLMLRAYLIYDLWNLPSYVYADSQFISTSGFQPKLMLFDVGLAVRPFGSCQQCEFRFGAENTGDFQVGNVLNLWYASVRFVF